MNKINGDLSAKKSKIGKVQTIFSRHIVLRAGPSNAKTLPYNNRFRLFSQDETLVFTSQNYNFPA